ncbi:non-ribosomal peptide synthetase [Vineibacter terrae]|uniref:non-ribosomal peptide synthetase n=1 Tax=Vineibacter terrae TaxID=2586908 RepID=UPI002E34532B|nr:non-ribosomal peptide synthetase [Vineibacter terrae]HEX2885890.1 non-ribosomal peptide synthetase [Vineibacter terrae]
MTRKPGSSESGSVEIECVSPPPAPAARLPERQSDHAIDRIAAGARARPDAVALRAGATEISYGALIAAADALAADLATLGVGPDVAVGICVPRSIDFVVAILATLRAGGAFLPLDPAWPIDRIRRVLDDTGAAVVIAPSKAAARLAAGNRTAVASERDGRRTDAATSLATDRASDDDLAYIISTSGSTGEPKGVEITQRNLANLIDWHIATFKVGAGDNASCVAGLSFDAVIWELLPALAAGAALHLVDERLRGSADGLRDWLVAAGITIAFVPTPLAEPLITSSWPAGTRLRTLLTGGDILHVWPRAGLPFTVVNNYGPSECTVVATSGVVSPCAWALGVPTIGRPIANTQVHVLDEAGQPVPAGHVGEICIGGANVGRGYRRRPALTAASFVTRPDLGERLYRTGDLGSWTPEGDIAFHGRRDAQVKVRGHRLEPDEISAALARHPMVRQSAVVAQGDGADRRLVAYVVPRDATAPRGPELRDFLSVTLPAYMLPEAFVRIAALPLTANGKLDRPALPLPTAANMLPGARYRAPASPVERGIASVIEDLLGIDQVGADDNFFLLGGHSLLGTQLVLRLRDMFGAEFALRDLFEAQTVARLAQKVEQSVTAMVLAMGDDEVRRRLAQ